MLRKKILTILAVVTFSCTYPIQAQVWTSGHHIISSGDEYWEIYMYNDCILDIFGGDIARLAAYDTTVTNWYDGQMYTLWTRDDSIVNIYGGDLDILWAAESSRVNIFAYDVAVMPTGGRYNQGYATGYFYSNDEPFYFDISQDTYLHINVIPEPATFLLLGLGSLWIVKKK
jgi:hypothetical protein